MTVEEVVFKILREDESFGMSADELCNSVQEKFSDREPGGVRAETIDALNKGLAIGTIIEAPNQRGFYCWNR